METCTGGRLDRWCGEESPSRPALCGASRGDQSPAERDRNGALMRRIVLKPKHSSICRTLSFSLLHPFPLFWFLSAVRNRYTFKIASRDIFIDRLWQVSLRFFFYCVFWYLSLFVLWQRRGRSLLRGIGDGECWQQCRPEGGRVDSRVRAWPDCWSLTLF